MAKKGQPKTGGRKKGGRNKATKDVQSFVDAVFSKVDPIALCNKLLASEDEKVVAGVLKMLMEYRFGKPAQPVTGENGQGPVLHKLEIINHIERPVRPSALGTN